MYKPVILAGLAAALVAVPAQAHRPADHPEQAKGPKAATPDCTKLLKVGYSARGTLVDASLTQSAGQTTARRGDDRYDGTVQVDVKKANHKAPKGVQPFTLTGARVLFYDADHNDVADQPKAGDRVALHGKMTKLRKGCDTSGFTPTITVRNVHFHPAKPADQS